jgi:2-polyprenyl-6-methoxyphenol hydroxylase-like FAD-dependent oxidoreductase
MPSPDVLIAGGGPAGLAAAIALRQRGFAVTVAEPLQPPVDKPCGEGVMPGGVEALRLLGIRVGLNATRFNGISFREGSLLVSGRFLNGYGMAIRRTNLHRLLVEHAAESGVILRWGVRITEIAPDGAIIDGRRIACRWVIGADGRYSEIRRLARLPEPVCGVSRVGLRQHFRVRPWNDFVEVHCREAGQVVVTPVAPDEICITAFSEKPFLRMKDLLRCFPAVVSRLNSAEATSPIRGALAMSGRVAKIYQRNVALIGDAAGTIDAITGQGLSIAFGAAHALAETLAAGGDLARYQRLHRRLADRPAQIARILLLLAAKPRLRVRLLRFLLRWPRLLEYILDFHSRTLHGSVMAAERCR